MVGGRVRGNRLSSVYKHGASEGVSCVVWCLLWCQSNTGTKTNERPKTLKKKMLIMFPFESCSSFAQADGTRCLLPR